MSDGYVEAFDPRKSGRVSMQTFQSQLRRVESSATTMDTRMLAEVGFLTPSFNSTSRSKLPVDIVLSVALSKSLLALAWHVARDWILAQAISLWSLLAATMVLGAIGLAVWERAWHKPRDKGKRREEQLPPTYAVVFTCEVALALFALAHLSALRFILLTAFNQLWARGPPIGAFIGGGHKSLGKGNTMLISTAMIVAAFFIDSALTGSAPKPAYVYILAYILCSGQRIDMLSAHVSEVRGKAHARASAGSALIACVIMLVHRVFGSEAGTHRVPATSKPVFDTFPVPEPSLPLLLASSALLAIALIVVDPLVTRNLTNIYSPARQFSSGYPVAVGASLFVGFVGFGQLFSAAELIIGLVSWLAISHLVSSDPRSVTTYSSSKVATSAGRQPLLTNIATFGRHFKATIKTILATPDSRRIYFFLCLNLAFMFVQMAYGIWTNSLGLISDSIHMFFDCLALAMGLFASVMATWERNNKFTYGYSRVETLSGFANGIFLCLISIFIVFEAIQRLIDPPEMNTNQLLVVSSLGLAVNLVGMFATGHHHHGHSHGGGHSHGHSHAAATKTHDHGHGSNSSKCDGGSHNSHSHGHSHANGSSKDTHEHGGHGSHANGHDHSHASHAYEEDDDDSGAAASGHSHNMKGVFLHVMADTLGSVGVIISTLLIQKFGWTGFDPLASIMIAVLIFASVVPLVIDSGRLLVLDMGEDREAEVRSGLLAVSRIEGVHSYTNPRFWAKDPSSIVGSICIQLAPSKASQDTSRTESSMHSGHYADIEKTRQRVRKALRSAIGGLDELVIQVEPTEGFR
ncbi:putative zinc transporter msc2 [Microbotryomycetes sp. JL201]|nr:putative zinc transporter msc2 [Microbotryomycetes sp. JL201]